MLKAFSDKIAHLCSLVKIFAVHTCSIQTEKKPQTDRVQRMAEQEYLSNQTETYIKHPFCMTPLRFRTVQTLIQPDQGHLWPLWWLLKYSIFQQGMLQQPMHSGKPSWDTDFILLPTRSKTDNLQIFFVKFLHMKNMLWGLPIRVKSCMILLALP